MDYILLRKLIVDKEAPIWELNKQTKKYKKKELTITSGEDIQSYLLNQVLLHGDIKTEYQLTQYGVVFPICPPRVIDRDYLMEKYSGKLE